MSDDKPAAGEEAKKVDQLRQELLDDSTLMKIRTEDAYLLRFLNCTNFDVDLAFKKIEAYHQFIKDRPDWFATIPPLDKKPQIEKNDKAVLRERDREGRTILVVKLGRMDAVNSCPPEQSQIFDMWLEYFMDDPLTQKKGLSAILDMKDFSWRLFRWFTPYNIRLVVRKVDLYPFQELLLHVVNTNFFLNAVIKLIWPFLNERIKAMFKFHIEDWPALHEYIDPQILPAEYGGTGPDIDFEKSNKALFDQNEEIGRKLKYQRVPCKD